MSFFRFLPFRAILAAALHTLHGPVVYFGLVAGLLLLSALANRLSRAFERSQQRSRELARLELNHRRQIWKQVETLRARPGYEDVYLMATAPQMGAPVRS